MDVIKSGSATSLFLGLALKAIGFGLILSAFAAPALAIATNVDAPEIDPGSISSALTLLAGGLVLIKGRGRRHPK